MQSSTHATAPTTVNSAARLRGLRGASFGALIMLVVQYCLGMWVNLYATLPASDHGKGLLAALGAAIADGPVGLSLHAILGLGLLVTGIGAVLRAVTMRAGAWIVVTVIALLALVIATYNGARFVSAGANEASFGMALATAVAMVCYLLVVSGVTRPTR